MQHLTGLVFCKKKVKTSHGTIFLLIPAKKARILERVLRFFVFLPRFGYLVKESGWCRGNVLGTNNGHFFGVNLNMLIQILSIMQNELVGTSYYEL